MDHRIDTTQAPNNLNQMYNTLNQTIFLITFLLLKNNLIVSIILVQFNNLSFCCVNVVFIKTCNVYESTLIQ